MPRYAAFLRGVSPMNCSMPALKKALERAGFTDVKTVVSSGNAVYSSRAASEATLARKCEAAMKAHLGTAFMTIVRPIDYLADLLERDPWAKLEHEAGAKRVVTFLRDAPKPKPALPAVFGGARILAIDGREVFTAYVPGNKGPEFMVLIEKTLGKDVTTRTWDTVARIVKAAG